MNHPGHLRFQRLHSRLDAHVAESPLPIARGMMTHPLIRIIGHPSYSGIAGHKTRNAPRRGQLLNAVQRAPGGLFHRLDILDPGAVHIPLNMRPARADSRWQSARASHTAYLRTPMSRILTPIIRIVFIAVRSEARPSFERWHLISEIPPQLHLRNDWQASRRYDSHVGIARSYPDRQDAALAASQLSFQPSGALP